ncbi:MAG: alpha/beta hydrolase [Mycobacteriales bacterium]
MAVDPAVSVRGTGHRPVTAVALILAGGQVVSGRRSRPWQLAVLRMRPFARALHEAGARDGLAVWTQRYRYRGWSRDDAISPGNADPVADARWALAEVRRRHGNVPVAVVGHSMGGRVAVHVADDPSVAAVAALAPWITPAETPAGFTHRSLLVAHGTLDRITDPRASYRFAVQAREVSDRVARFELSASEHGMVVRARAWHDLVRRFVLGELRLRPPDPAIEAAMAAPGDRGLRADWPVGCAAGRMHEPVIARR